MIREIKQRIVMAFKILFFGACPLVESYKQLAARQEPLGEKFEKVWNENIEELYEE